MKYLIRLKGKRNTIHLWDERSKDSFCRMYSTGGLKKENYLKVESIDYGVICNICNVNVRKKLTRK